MDMEDHIMTEAKIRYYQGMANMPEGDRNQFKTDARAMSEPEIHSLQIDRYIAGLTRQDSPPCSAEKPD